MTPGRLRVDSGVTATLMVCGSRSFWPRLMYHTSINSKSSKLSIAPTLDTHTRFLGQSLRGLRGLRGSFQVRENQNQNFQSPFHFFTCRSSNSGWSSRHPGVLDLWCPVLPHPPSHLSAAESPQRHGNFFFPVQKSTRQQVMALFFLVAVAVTLSRHKYPTGSRRSGPPLSPCATARRPKHARRVPLCLVGVHLVPVC